MAFIPNWSPTAYYNTGDKVFYLDVPYELIVAGSTPGVFGVAPPSNPAAWQQTNVGGGVAAITTNGVDSIEGIVNIDNGDGITASVVGQTITIASTAEPPVAFLYNFYVSAISGNDTSGAGTIISPFQTIGRALDVANAIPDSNRISIFLSAGIYNENVSVTRANTFISGSATSLSTATQITGVVTVDMTASGLPIIIGGLSSVQVYGVEYNNSVARQQSYLVTDCLISPINGPAVLLTDTSVGGTGDLTIQSCLIYAANISEAVICSNGFLTLINTEIKNNPADVGINTFVLTQGTGRVNMFGCVLTQANATSTVKPIIVLSNNATTQSMVFSNSTIQYSSATSDAGTGGKCCIRCSNSATITNILLFNNLLLCQGATTTNGTPGQFLVLQRTGAGSVVCTNGQNSGGPTANHLPPNGGGFTKVPLVNVA
jgi:hypothetical protein